MSKKKQAGKERSRQNNPQAKYAAEKRVAKKAAVLGTEKKSRTPVVVLISTVVLLIGGGIFFVSQKEADRPLSGGSLSSQASGLEVTHPVGLFDDGRARHFQYTDDNGITIKYFVLKSSDGVIRAAFDACDVCWKAGKGYYQSGDVMVCGNCKREFASILVNVVKGGCNPAPLNRTVKDGKVIIAVPEILKGRPYFNPNRA